MLIRNLLLALGSAILAAGCATSSVDKPVSHALPLASSGVVVRTANSLAARHGRTKSSFRLLENNREALDWRLALADSAHSSIDCQYFLWHADHSGRLLLSRLLQAADRGVRVRVLVDDFLLKAKDRDIAALSRHPNLEIRIFNPAKLRRTMVGGGAEFLLNFSELNRRMHNKTFTADNAISIVGGRNIADAYFGLDEKYNFRDLDTLVAGPVVPEISAGFDLYWNSARATPGDEIGWGNSGGDLDAVRSKYGAIIREGENGALKEIPIPPRNWSREFARLPSRTVSGRATFLQDTAEESDDDRRLVRNLFSADQAPKRELLVATPYLIPLKTGMERLRQWRAAGVEVKIVVPTLAANNHTAAHSHYKKYRKGILESGARLYEYRHDPSEASRRFADTPPVRGGFVSFHLKALVIDRRRCFIGSLNLDPRAMEINTESGLLVDSPQLAGQLADVLEDLAKPENSWELSLDARNKLLWTSATGTRTSPPARGAKQRFADFFTRMLPVEGQL
jgi:putative cardiolipin synthase